jgi:hypothetical protein
MGIIFKTIETIKIWLAEYAVFHQRSFMIKHSDENKRYVVVVLGQFALGKERMTAGG